MNQFKKIAAEHQKNFKEKFITKELGFFVHNGRNVSSPYFLPENEWKIGLNYFAKFKDDIDLELNGFNNKMRDANMLRSEHIPLNIFVPMRKFKDNGKSLFNRLLGEEMIYSIDEIHIEMAGGKSKNDYDRSKYLNDGTSFDTRIDFTHIDGKKGYIGIEVKYTEVEYKIKKEKENKEYRDIWLKENDRYQIVTDKSNYYNDDKYEQLKQDEFRQIWRNHILGASMVINGEIDHFFHIHLYPKKNDHFEKVALPKYIEMLSDKGKETFRPITYEKLFEEMKILFSDNDLQKSWVNYLIERYLFT